MVPFPRPPIGGAVLPPGVLPKGPTDDIPTNTDDIDGSSTLADMPASFNQMEWETMIRYGIFFTIIGLLVILVVFIVGFITLHKRNKGRAPLVNAGGGAGGGRKQGANTIHSNNTSPSPPSSGSENRGLHDSWDSALDSSHGHKHHDRSLPVQMFVSVHNWFNRRKRLFQARRIRRTARLATQPQTRAAVYYSQGRGGMISGGVLGGGGGGANQPNNSQANNSCSSRLSGSNNNGSNGSMLPDSEALAALMSAPVVPIPSLVSNPNYFSEIEQRLMENPCKCFQAKLGHLF